MKTTEWERDNMELKIYVEDLTGMIIDEKSFYNNNYYRIPMKINNCDVLFGESDDDYTTLWALGEFVNDKFEVNCWLGYSSTYDSKTPEHLDLSQASKTMI